MHEATRRWRKVPRICGLGGSWGCSAAKVGKGFFFSAAKVRVPPGPLRPPRRAGKAPSVAHSIFKWKFGSISGFGSARKFGSEFGFWPSSFGSVSRFAPPLLTFSHGNSPNLSLLRAWNWALSFWRLWYDVGVSQPKPDIHALSAAIGAADHAVAAASAARKKFRRRRTTRRDDILLARREACAKAAAPLRSYIGMCAWHDFDVSQETAMKRAIEALRYERRQIDKMLK